METLPPEIIVIVITSLSKQNSYDDLISLKRTNIRLYQIIDSESDNIFTGLPWIAWLYTKPFYIALFHQALRSHYGLSIDALTAPNQQHIPDIRNNINYTPEVAIEQFLKIRVMIRQLFKQPITDILQDIKSYNKEVDYLCDLCIQFIRHILARIIARHNNWSTNIRLIENIGITINTESSEFLAFFHCMNRLNTLVCHIGKILGVLNTNH